MSYEDIFNLSGKSIILTGATGYLGKFFANALLEFGADLAILDLKYKELSELCSNLKSKFSRVPKVLPALFYEMQYLRRAKEQENQKSS